MAASNKKIWTLTDVDQDIYLDTIALSPDTVGGAASGYSVTKRVLHGGLREGVEVIEVFNGAFRFVVLPTRGMGIWNARYGAVQLGWKSPVKGPVHPKFVRLNEASGIGWLDGFDELLVRCGLESNGAPEFLPNGALRYGLHGKIANLPAHKVEVVIDSETGEIAVTGVVDESRMFGACKLRLTSTIATKVGQPGMTVTDVISNLSAEPSDLEMLYHINFGMPLLGPGARVVLPIKTLVPRTARAVEDLPTWDVYGPETPRQPEAVFFADLAADPAGCTQALLHNDDATAGVSLTFNKNQLPCFSLWKNSLSQVDGYVTGLEPALNYPNTKSFEKAKGRVVTLAPGQSRTCQVTMTVCPDAASVQSAKESVARYQHGTRPQILPQPHPDWAEG